MQDARGAGVGRQKTAGRLFVGVVRAPPILHQHTVRVLTANEDRNGTFDVILSLPPPLREREHRAPVRRFSVPLQRKDMITKHQFALPFAAAAAARVRAQRPGASLLYRADVLRCMCPGAAAPRVLQRVLHVGNALQRAATCCNVCCTRALHAGADCDASPPLWTCHDRAVSAGAAGAGTGAPPLPGWLQHRCQGRCGRVHRSQ